MTEAPTVRVQRPAARRTVLSTIVVLGMVISIAGLGGVFAVFTDRATTGTNSAASAARPAAADLEIADGGPLNGAPTCGVFEDDLATGLITIADLTPSANWIGYPGNFLCIRNSGADPLELSLSALDLVDIDHACTGDEGGVSFDTTCGNDELGELSPQLLIDADLIACDGSANLGGAGGTPTLPAFTSSIPFMDGADPVVLDPENVICLSVYFFYNPSGNDAIVSQSDTATWRWAIDGTTTT